MWNDLFYTDDWICEITYSVKRPNDHMHKHLQYVIISVGVIQCSCHTGRKQQLPPASPCQSCVELPLWKVLTRREGLIVLLGKGYGTRSCAHRKHIYKVYTYCIHCTYTSCIYTYMHTQSLYAERISDTTQQLADRYRHWVMTSVILVDLWGEGLPWHLLSNPLWPSQLRPFISSVRNGGWCKGEVRGGT